MDIKLIEKDDGTLTLGQENGDLTQEDGFDTMINVLLGSHARAPSDRISKPELRRGWPGDISSPKPNRTFGSLLWLTDQSRVNTELVNETVGFAQSALDSLTTDGIAKNVSVTGEIVPQRGVKLKIDIKPPSGGTITHYVNTWELTGNAN